MDGKAEVTVFVMNLDREVFDRVTDPMLGHLNVGTGVHSTIRESEEVMARIVRFKGAPTFDTTKPDGTPGKLIDVSKLTALGWQACTSLEDGLALYAWFRDNSTDGDHANAAQFCEPQQRVHTGV